MTPTKDSQPISAAVSDLDIIRKCRQVQRRILGLDVGDKTIGLATSDIRCQIASSLQTIARKNLAHDSAVLAKLVREFNIAALVIGLPLEMTGQEGRRCQSVRQFARNLQKSPDFTEMPMVFFDERLSTAVVERAMIAADLSRRKRSERIDAAAAAYILQSALDRVRQ
ncbi:MAG: Holliday junction resolvase RuvX [Alphaproteobacteria bacterium]|nr:Holliday junction resolvase RuvX [Alphaproteobacteria bacterium]